MGAPDYDKQSEEYDGRAGIGDDVARRVADTVLKSTRQQSRIQILDIGCGTGEIGRYLAERAKSYTGMDRSAGMLKVFRNRLRNKDAAALLEADGNLPWPVGRHSFDLIFSSRALHLLSVDHVMKEMKKAGSASGFTCMLGRVSRDDNGVAQTMRRQMHEILRRHGFSGRNGNRNLADISLHCARAGATILGLRVVDSWQKTESPLQSLSSWRSKEGLAGLGVPRGIHAAVLDELERWALQHYGSIRFTRNCTSRYELCGFYFPARG